MFPISRDPPEGGTIHLLAETPVTYELGFPISRDPPEGGTLNIYKAHISPANAFPISRDPPEGGTCPVLLCGLGAIHVSNF